MKVPVSPSFTRAVSAIAAVLTLGMGPLPAAALAPGPAALQAVPMPRARAHMNARVFDTVWNTVRRQYYDPQLHGVDWRAARDLYRPQALRAVDDRQLYRAVSQMLDLLDDQHAGAISPAMARRQDAAGSRRAVMGVVLARENLDLWRVEAVRPGSPAEEAGVQPGWVLQTVDGQSWGVDFDVEDGVPLRLDLTDDVGVLHVVTLTPREMEPVAPFRIDASRPGVVVLRAEGFEPGLGRWLGEQLDGLSPDTDVVIDLRGNPGGLLMEADATLSCFLPLNQAWATRISRAGRPMTLSVMRGCGDLSAPASNDVAVLVDHTSRSAAELTPAALQEAGRALIVGEHTAGAVLISQDTHLPDGGRLTLSRADYVTAGGVRLEKHGVEPDIVVPVSRADRAAGRDPALDAAITALAQPADVQRAQALSRRPSL